VDGIEYVRVKEQIAETKSRVKHVSLLFSLFENKPTFDD